MAKKKMQIAGRCRLTSMSEWDNGFINADVPAYINSGKDGLVATICFHRGSESEFRAKIT